MRRMTRFAFLILAFSACKTTQRTGSSALNADANAPMFTKLMDNAAVYDGFSKEASGLAQAKRSLKFLIDKRDANNPQVYFFNGNYRGRCAIEPECTKYHYNFAKEHLRISESLDTFNKQTYFTENKRFVAGTLASYQLAGNGLTYGIQLYPLDVAKEAGILEISKIVRKAFAIPDSQLAFVSTGDQQTFATVKADMEAAGVAGLSLEAILGSTNFIPLHPGEAWGYLRLFPRNPDNLEAADIPVFDLLPLDLTVVSATITKTFQDTNSHINLKSKERNTPNMILRDAGPEHATLSHWIDKPVHLKVTPQGWTIDATTDAIVKAKVEERTNRPWVALQWKSSKELLAYEAMCPNKPEVCLKLSEVYGTKAANLGFLKEIFRDRNVPLTQPLTYDPVPVGFGVPLQFYKDFVDLPANAAIKAKIEELIEKEKAGQLDSAARGTLSAEVRQMILNGEFPKENLDAIIAKAREVAGPAITKWKLRSSANAEDIEAFNGAGLHDSYTGKLNKTDNPDHSCKLELDEDDAAEELVKLKAKPQTFACAIKGVYAGLWNKRSIEERSFARLDHASVSMGLTVLPSYDTESPIIANSVVITRVLNTQDIFGYSLSIQKDNNTVTNPTPGSWSEMDIAAMGLPGELPTLTTMRFAKPLANSPPLTQSVLSHQKTLDMALMVKKIEEAYCRANPRYYRVGSCDDVSTDAGKPKALDVEFKCLQDGRFVVKQVREFGGK